VEAAVARGIEFNAENSTRAGPFPPKFRTAVELNPNIAAVDKDKRVDVVSSIHGFRSVAEFVALRAGALALAHDRTVDECLSTRRPSARRHLSHRQQQATSARNDMPFWVG
jgi:hypothetical protein